MRTIILSAILCFAGTTSLSSAQEAEDITRTFDDAAVVVVIVDLDRLDLTGVADAIASAGSEDLGSERLANSLRRYFQPVVQQLRELGVSKLYAVYSLHDWNGGMPYLVLPTSSEEQADKVSQLMQTGNDAGGKIVSVVLRDAFRNVFVRGTVVFAGTQDLEQRLSPDRIPDRSIGWKAALAVPREGAIRVIGVVTEDQRRVLREFAPKLPEGFGQLSGERLAELRWFSLGVDVLLPAVKGIVQTDSDASAQMLSALLGTAAAQAPVKNDTLRDIVNATQITVDGDRLELSMVPPANRPSGEVLASLLDDVVPLSQNFSLLDLRNHLKQLGLGMHNFHDAYGSFPPPASFDENGQPLLSWRVYLLPYLDANDLYRQFHLDEPWDSVHNLTLVEQMPDVFASSSFDLNARGLTTLQLPVGENTVFHGQAGVPIREITDGTSNTIMILEVPPERAVIWTKPEDFPVDPPSLKDRLFGSRDQFWTTFCDGSARAIEGTIPDETLSALVTKSGGEIIDYGGF
ncbi:MAG: DUF1559 domain-containing protein [Planctomycetaceae bacterium]|nr:DUF1559 domain-containing protein [Planctomycetaceae bacterium]